MGQRENVVKRKEKKGEVGDDVETGRVFGGDVRRTSDKQR